LFVGWLKDFNIVHFYQAVTALHPSVKERQQVRNLTLKRNAIIINTFHQSSGTKRWKTAYDKIRSAVEGPTPPTPLRAGAHFSQAQERHKKQPRPNRVNGISCCKRFPLYFKRIHFVLKDWTINNDELEPTITKRFSLK